MKQVFVCIIIALLAFGCTYQQPAVPPAQPGQNAVPAAPAQPSANPAGAASAASVEMSGFAFNPASIEISAGTTVTWKNKDSAPHTATGDKGEFATSTIPSGGEGSYKFSTPGTYAYHCSVHPSMKGTIIVK